MLGTRWQDGPKAAQRLHRMPVMKYPLHGIKDRRPFMLSGRRTPSPANGTVKVGMRLRTRARRTLRLRRCPFRRATRLKQATLSRVGTLRHQAATRYLRPHRCRLPMLRIMLIGAPTPSLANGIARAEARSQIRAMCTRQRRKSRCLPPTQRGQDTRLPAGTQTRQVAP